MLLRTYIILLLGLAGFSSQLIAEESDVVRTLLDQNRLDEAVPVCRQFEVLAGNRPEAMIDCAWVYYRTGRFEAAEQIRTKLKSPEFAFDQQMLMAYAYIDRKQYDKAREILNELEKAHKGTAKGLKVQELLAEMYENMGRLDTAAFIYKQLVGDDPSRARAHWGLARHHLSRRENSKAIVHLIKTTELWPTHMASRFNLGVLYISQDNLADAGRWLAESYKLNRADAGVLEQLGVLFEKKGQFGDALKYWQKALDINKKSEVARSKLKLYYGKLIDRAIEENDYARALLYLENAASVGNNDPRNLLRRGIIYRNQRKYEKAAGDLLAYLNAHPEDPEAARELGICYLNMSLFKDAGKYFERALELQPSYGMNYAWYAWVLEKTGNFCDARTAWSRAAELIKDERELIRATRRLASVNRRTQGKCDKVTTSEVDGAEN